MMSSSSSTSSQSDGPPVGVQSNGVDEANLNQGGPFLGGLRRGWPKPLCLFSLLDPFLDGFNDTMHLETPSDNTE